VTLHGLEGLEVEGEGGLSVAASLSTFYKVSNKKCTEANDVVKSLLLLLLWLVHVCAPWRSLDTRTLVTRKVQAASTLHTRYHC